MGGYVHCGAVLQMLILGVAGEVLTGAMSLMDRLDMPIVLKVDGVVGYSVEDTSGRRQVYAAPSGVAERGIGRGERGKCGEHLGGCS